MLLVQLHTDATLIFVMAESATQVFDVPHLSCSEVNFLVSTFKLAIAMDWFMHFFKKTSKTSLALGGNARLWGSTN